MLDTEIIEIAKNIYDTYKVTQVELDNVTKLLKEAKEEALLLISKQEVYQEQLAISKGLIETTEIGEYQGNVSQETIDVFKNTVDNIEKEYLKGKYTKTPREILWNSDKAE